VFDLSERERDSVHKLIDSMGQPPGAGWGYRHPPSPAAAVRRLRAGAARNGCKSVGELVRRWRLELEARREGAEA